MKQRFLALSAVAIFFLSACGNDNGDKMHESHDTTTTATTENHATEAGAVAAKEVIATFPQVDASISAALKESIDHYLHVKNALAEDNGSEAGKGAEALGAALQKIDKSLLTPDQKKVYDEAADDVKVQAANIAKQTGDIKQQRAHFVTLSEEVYTLAKAFGGGRTLYHDHCPMAKNNEGAMWLSESREIRNPYFGAQMLECGTIEEVIQK